jgi:heparanase 1
MPLGPVVPNAGPSRPGLHPYAHCLRGQPGGVPLLAIDASRTDAASLSLPVASARHALSAPEPDSTSAQRNGQVLQLQANGDLPTIAGQQVPAGRIDLAPASITVLAMPEAGNPACGS